MGSMEVVGDDVQPRSYWRCSKQDFLPEESFQNWSTYRKALSQTGHRFKNRLLSRSNDNDEIGELRKQSENDMKRCLTWWDLMWFGFGSVLGAGIFAVTGLETQRHAGPAIVLSYVVSGLSAMLSVFCYTEFSVEIPAAGGAFAYLRIELGDFVAFITAGNILLESIVISAVVARAWTSYFTSLLNRPYDSLLIHTNLAVGFNLLDPIAVAVLAIAGSSWCPQGNDHCSSGWDTWAGTVYHSYCTSPHDSTMVCSCSSKDRNPHKRYSFDCHFKWLHCFLFKLGCLGEPVISEHALYLHDDGGRTSSEEVLCERNHPTTAPLEASHFLADHYCFLNGDFSLLGTESQWSGWLCRDGSSLVLWYFGDGSVFTSTEVTKSLGSSAGSLVAILVNCNKHLSYGIFGS